MEYCTSVCCFRHNNVIKFEEKQWWGSCEGFIYPKIELNKLAHCFTMKIYQFVLNVVIVELVKGLI